MMKSNPTSFLGGAAPPLVTYFLVLGFAAASENARPLPGSEIALEQAVGRADAIATGVLVDLGFTLPTAPGQAAYENAKFEIKKVLKGSCDKTISVRVVVLDHDIERESAPEKGREYILFVAADGDEKRSAFKILTATNENIGDVGALLDVAGSPGALPGHQKSNEELAKAAGDVVIARFTFLGYGGSDAPGTKFYERAEIEIISPLRGDRSGKLRVSYAVQLFPEDKREKPPILGARYIMFLQQSVPNQYHVQKLIPAIEENVKSVKALLVSHSTKQ